MKKVKLVCSVITGELDLLETFRSSLSGEFGPTDMESDLFQFNYTNYYEKEMGTNLSRKIYSFETLVDPGTIADVKIRTIAMEKEITRQVARSDRLLRLRLPRFARSDRLPLSLPGA